jgi:hypothetical protein
MAQAWMAEPPVLAGGAFLSGSGLSLGVNAASSAQAKLA